MGRKIIKSSVTVEWTCDFPGCGAQSAYTSKSEGGADEIAENTGWHRLSSGSLWSERRDWRYRHFHTCSTCKGVEPEPAEGESCDCCGKERRRKCPICHGNLFISDKEPRG